MVDEATAERGLVPAPRVEITGPPMAEGTPLIGGMTALARMSEEEFTFALDAWKTHLDRIERIKDALLVSGVDYGVIAGVKKPALAKSGAEKLMKFCGYVPEVTTILVQGDGENEPDVRYDSECLLHLGSLDGPVVGTGHGTCNSWENKYRYRNLRAGLVCPDCGREGIIKTRRDQFWHPSDARPDGGCGSNFDLDDTRITSQTPGSQRIINPDPWDLTNTMMKISGKRSITDAVLYATATSGMFTQDLEESLPENSDRVVAVVEEKPVDTGETVPGSGIWEGIVRKGSKIESDLELHREADEDPMGYGGGRELYLGFRLDLGGRRIANVVLRDELAEDFWNGDESSLLVGDRVRVHGNLEWKEWWKNQTKMPAYRLVVASAVEVLSTTAASEDSTPEAIAADQSGMTKVDLDANE